MGLLRYAYLMVRNSFNAPPTDEEIEDAAARIRKQDGAVVGENMADPRGACVIIYPSMIGGRPFSCTDDMDQADCNILADEMHGTAQPIFPGKKCRDIPK